MIAGSAESMGKQYCMSFENRKCLVSAFSQSLLVTKFRISWNSAKAVMANLDRATKWGRHASLEGTTLQSRQNRFSSEFQIGFLPVHTNIPLSIAL